MEETDLKETWERYKNSPSIEDRDALIVHYLFLVKGVVGRLGTSLPGHVKLDDLYSSGVTGLIRAVEKFDDSRKAKFESYANLLIKGAIIDELRALDWIPRSVHQKVQKVAVATSDLQQKLGRDPTDQELSAHLGVTDEEFEELLFRVRPTVLLPLNAQRNEEGEDTTFLSEIIPDEGALSGFDVADRNEIAHFLSVSLEALSPQEKKVLELYYFEDLMLKEIAKRIGVTESRVSQIHTKALILLRYRLEKFAKDRAF